MSSALPPSASIATPLEGDKLHAPSAARNAPVLAKLLQEHAPPKGRALEIASGTGQHIASFAQSLPNLHWHPSEVDAQRRRSIDAYAEGLDNVATACHLDATLPGWGADHGPWDLIFLSNLLHLIATPAAKTLVAETALALAPGGSFILYGPFKRDGVLTSAGDARFDAELRQADPAIGYKDDRDVLEWLGTAGLALKTRLEMPANNLAFIARRAPR